MSRSSNFSETNGTKSTTARFTTTATIKCEAYPADDGGSPPPSPTPVSVGKRWQNNMNSANNISNGKSLITNGHGPKASFTSLNGGASFGSAVKKTGSVEDRWKPNSTSTTRDYSSSSVGQGVQNGLQDPVRPSRISLAAMGSKNDNYSGPKSGAIGLGGGSAPPPPPAPPMPSFGASNGSAGFSGRSVSRADTSNRGSTAAPSSSFSANTNSLPRGFNSKTFNQNSVPRGYTPPLVNGTVPSKGIPSNSSSGSSTLPSGSSSTLPRGFNSSAATNGGPKFSGGSTISSAGLANTLRRADSADPATASASGKPKVDPNDPQVRKLVYNMYRGLLDKKHDHSNTIIGSLPQLQVDRDEGVKNRVFSMMKQQEELKSGKISTMNGPAGPPPPPPPPPFVVAGATPPVMPEPVQVSRPAPRSAPIMPLVAPPAALAGAMMKDKKPFTYTPGGLDLSEIRSPRMQRRLSRNAALEGARPSPLAQHSSTGSPTPGSPSPSVPSGLAVQVLPMPGMAMAKSTPATPPPPAQPKEPVVKKSMCGPPPPPPPFTIGSGDFKLSPPETKSVPSVSKAIASPPMTSYIPNEPVLTTPSSPPFSSPPSDPRSTSLSLASTNSNDSGTNIPAPPPPPPQSAAARRASIVKNSLNGDSTPPTPIAVAPPFQNQAHAAQSQAPFKGPEGSEVKTNNTSAAASSDISSNSFAESDTSRSRESSSMAVEDSSTSFREESVTPSVLSNVDRPEEDMEHYNSNESLLKQISALEQITAKHQSKQESSSGLRVSNGNARIGSNTPERQASEPKVQPILRLSVSKQQSSQKQHEEDMRRKEFEQHERRKELEELERQKQFEEHERQVQLEEQERQRQFEEHERQIQIEKQERQMQLEEQEMHQRQMEEHDRERQLQKERQQEIDRQKQQEIERQKQQEMERQRQQEMERQRQQEMECQKQQEMERQRQQEMERLRQQEMEHQKQQEMERQRQQEMDRQRQQEMEQQELERQRQQEMEQKREQEKFEQQQEAERKQQQQERLRQQEESHQRQKEEEEQRQLEAQRRQELENQKLREEQEWQRHQEEEEQVRLEEQERKRYQMQQQQPENQNRFKRQGSVPIQVRQAPFRADTNQQQNQVDSQGNPHVRASSASRSPNVSPTSGLIKAPLPWMSAIPRRETSAPPEFVNYAQTAQSRLQQQRAQRQQSYEQGKAPQAPSPVLKEAVVVAPPVVYQHPGQNDYGRSTLPRNSKLNSGPAQRPWVAKHQQYQQQPQQTSAQLPAQSPSYQQPQQVQRPGPGQRWPEVKQPNYLRQKSASEESNQRTVASGSQKIRIIPITVEQDSSSDQEQPYYPSSGNNSTIRSIPINSTYGPAYQVPVNISNTSIPPSPRTPQTPPTRAPLSSTTPPSPRWNQQPSFIAPPPQQQQQPKQQRFSLQQQQQQPPPPSTQQPQKVNYNNPIGLYSDGNAVEALQQMQQSLAQLNTGLQNAYPKFIQETISNSLPTRSVSSPGPGVVTAPDMNSAPMQSRSFRILQNVVDSEASGSEDELRGYLPQDTPEAYHTAQVKTFTGGVSSPRGGGGRRSSGYAPSPLAQQVPQQYAKYHDDGDDDPRGVSNSGAIPSRAFRALQQHTYGGQQEEAGPGESDL